MDKLLEKVYGMSAEEMAAAKEHLMVGGGSPFTTALQTGDGIRVTDINGKTYIDCTSQSWALYLGHANKEIREIVYEHMQNQSHIHQGFDTKIRYALAKKLTEIAPPHINRVSFTASSGLGIEAAIKLSLKNVEGSRKVIVLDDAYHGNSLTTAAASWTSTQASGKFTGVMNFRNGLNDLFIRVPNPYTYQWKKTNNPEDCVDYCLAAMENAIQREVVGQVAAILLEPIQASGGQIILPKRYLEGVRALADKYGCLLIFDEIQTYCRIGEWFAYNYFGVEPDIICTGKAIGAGFPMAAVLLRDGLKGFEMNAEELHTFANNTVSQVCALKQIEIIERDNLLENTRNVGKILGDGVKSMMNAYPEIGDVRQAGLHIGVEMVADPVTKEAHPAAAKIKSTAVENGLILGTGGFRKHILKIKPPLITTPADAAEILERWEATLKASLR
ncbi:MAG: aminotransferase class III-fold pyridoxal phosphate-dependent enzyme [Clostridia bacterium]|nr:aminotransferase class III-fold pyridoxal phosphate-dependent enzyme [Clostridia bacterium]MBR2328132.1 aminotransferase class III-fold pyridoxal phosphate-dependent enzyme [Clostridia bacterium]